MSVNVIIQLLASTPSTNAKLKILTENKENALLKRVLELTYDRVKFNYGMKFPPQTIQTNGNGDIDAGLDFLTDALATRTITGNAARRAFEEILNNLSTENANILIKILNRDLKIGIGTTQVNKIWPDICQKPPYMRCSILNEKTIRKINFPAYIQLKADGMYTACIVSGDSATFQSRSGEEREFPELGEKMLKFGNGVYIGELVIPNMTRQESNGLLNSDNPPCELINFFMWDLLDLDEFSIGFSRRPYMSRFAELKDIINEINDPNIIPIETNLVTNLNDCIAITSNWMKNGFEGGVLKDLNTPFKDHTSPTQLKIKLAMELDLRITGFTDGTPGTKREKTFGAIAFENDEGTIKGQTSGFTDAQLLDFNSRRDELIGSIIAVECNDLTKADGNDYYALSHPRFIEIRKDKNETDTLQRAMEIRQMKMGLDYLN